jgi:hypothetical protein
MFEAASPRIREVAISAFANLGLVMAYVCSGGLRPSIENPGEEEFSDGHRDRRCYGVCQVGDLLKEFFWFVVDSLIGLAPCSQFER